MANTFCSIKNADENGNEQKRVSSDRPTKKLIAGQYLLGLPKK